METDFYRHLTFFGRFLASCLILHCYQPLFSQSLNHNSGFWIETSLANKLKGKFSYQLDYQFRRQGTPEKLRNDMASQGVDQESIHHGMFVYPMNQVVRPWIHYQLLEKVRLSLSPLGWSGTWTPTGASSTSFRPELRTTFLVTVSQPIGRVILAHRYRYEYRLLGQNLPADGSGGHGYYQDITGPAHRQSRFRYQLRATIPLTQPKLNPRTYYLNTFEEVYLGVGHNVKPERIFDQNRLYLGIGYKATSALRVEVGYLNQLVPRGPMTDMNSALQVSVAVDDVNSFFRKAAPDQP